MRAYARIPSFQFQQICKTTQICKKCWNFKGNPLFVMHRSVEGSVRLRLVRMQKMLEF